MSNLLSSSHRLRWLLVFFSAPGFTGSEDRVPAPRVTDRRGDGNVKVSPNQVVRTSTCTTLLSVRNRTLRIMQRLVHYGQQDDTECSSSPVQNHLGEERAT